MTATCNAGDFATGGGALATNGDLVETYPANGGPSTSPTAWTATTTANNPNNITAYVVCVDTTP
ncbi:hypothetical protein [Streptomyces sp. NPDC056160]|uniref:hypothetical protein n=1 Tax=Streptomyces sp. NPDC056160 TaxID=3345731 RepID=UPI0035D861F9